MNDIITPTERAYLAERYRVGGLGPDVTIEYAIRTAHEYAETWAGDCPQFTRQIVARLHVRHLLEPDRGNKALLRLAIDTAIALGRACR